MKYSVSFVAFIAISSLCFNSYGVAGYYVRHVPVVAREVSTPNTYPTFRNLYRLEKVRRVPNVGYGRVAVINSPQYQLAQSRSDEQVRTVLMTRTSVSPPCPHGHECTGYLDWWNSANNSGNSEQILGNPSQIIQSVQSIEPVQVVSPPSKVAVLRPSEVNVSSSVHPLTTSERFNVTHLEGEHINSTVVPPVVNSTLSPELLRNFLGILLPKFPLNSTTLAPVPDNTTGLLPSTKIEDPRPEVREELSTTTTLRSTTRLTSTTPSSLPDTRLNSTVRPVLTHVREVNDTEDVPLTGHHEERFGFQDIKNFFVSDNKTETTTGLPIPAIVSSTPVVGKPPLVVNRAERSKEEFVDGVVNPGVVEGGVSNVEHFPVNVGSVDLDKKNLSLVRPHNVLDVLIVAIVPTNSSFDSALRPHHHFAENAQPLFKSDEHVLPARSCNHTHPLESTRAPELEQTFVDSV